MDTRQDEQDRGITIKSTAITMFFELPKENIEDVKQKTDGELSPFLGSRYEPHSRLELISSMLSHNQDPSSSST